jgi:hypothetical protein
MTHQIPFIVCMMLTLLLNACSHAEPIGKDALIEKTHHWKEPKAAIWYYIGSQNGRDFFQHYDLGVSERYSVESGQIVLQRTYPLTKDQKKWIVMRWGPMALSHESI